MKELNKTSGTVLVVERSETIRQSFCSTLQRHGYTTLAAADALMAYQLLTKNFGAIHAVVSNFILPGDDAMALLEKIKSNPLVKHIPVIFLSSERPVDKIQRAESLGLTAWIQKPYRAESFYSELKMAVAQVIRMQQISSQ